MLFALYIILFLGGIALMAVSFNVPAIAALLFVLGILLIAAALASPMIASALENRRAP